MRVAANKGQGKPTFLNLRYSRSTALSQGKEGLPRFLTVRSFACPPPPDNFQAIAEELVRVSHGFAAAVGSSAPATLQRGGRPNHCVWQSAPVAWTRENSRPEQILL
jgi:hypothetical protein